MRVDKRSLLAVVIMVVVLLSSVPAGRVMAQTKASPACTEEVELLASDSSKVAFRIRVPWERLGVDPFAAEGKEYVRLVLDGWPVMGVAGAPEVPFRATAIAVPVGATLTISVRAGRPRTLWLPADLAPAPTAEASDEAEEWGAAARVGSAGATLRRKEEPRVYSSNALYPGTLAAVVSDGMIRQQRVAGIAAYPIQYNPQTRELTVYESLEVEVALGGQADGQVQAIGARPESGPFEDLFRRELLNYESAVPWRQAVAAGDSTQSMAWAPPLPGYRVKVQREGFYRLTQAQLAAAGLPVDDLDPRTFRLYNMGSEVAIDVEGQSDGHFDPGDSLLFYGQAVDSKYTSYNVYWLTYGQGPGLRMASRDGTPVGAPPGAMYGASLHMEADKWYLSYLPGDEDLERYAWAGLNPPNVPTWSYTFSLAAPLTGGQTATLRASLFHRIGAGDYMQPRVRLYVNNTLVGDQTWARGTWYLATATFVQSLLVAGDNVVRLESPNNYNRIVIDWLELDYANTFTAVGDVLSFGFGTPGRWQYQVGNLSTNQAVAFDVTEAGAVQRIDGVVVTPSGGGYTATFEDEVVAETDYWVMTTSQFLSPESIVLDTPSDLQSTANGADYIIVTHPAFYAETLAIRDYRASQMLRAMSVDVQDVYDEFGYGIEGARPIHDFLAYAFGHWQAPAPTFVLLVGDGHYDPKNHLGYGRASYLPPYLAPVDPWMVETATDNRYVTVVGNDVFPDMIIGRLPVNSVAEIQAMIGKTIAYEQSPEPGDWHKRVLFVADDADAGGNFAQISDGVIDCCLPAPYQAVKVYYGLAPYLDPASARTAIQTEINAGKLIVNYVGHAGATAWAGEGLFRSSDVAALQNGARLPIMFPMTCYDGYFIYPYPQAWGYDSVGEVIVRADGKGAVASWSPSGEGLASGHDWLDRGAFDALLTDRVPTLGQATMAGKARLWATGANLDLVDTYLLLGDPALRVSYNPTAVVLTSFTAEPGSGRTVVIRWETSSEVDNLGFDLYRAEAEGGPEIRLNADRIPSQVPPGSPIGARYKFEDASVRPGVRYLYWLETVDVRDRKVRYGPVTATLEPLVLYLPLIR